MRSAKQLFQASPAFVGKHYEALLSNVAFESACAAALAEFVDSLPASAAEPSRAWDCYLQILGARAVLEKLATLHVNDDQSKPEPAPWQYPKPKGT